jgi:hypothetical protein
MLSAGPSLLQLGSGPAFSASPLAAGESALLAVDNPSNERNWDKALAALLRRSDQLVLRRGGDSIWALIGPARGRRSCPRSIAAPSSPSWICRATPCATCR